MLTSKDFLCSFKSSVEETESYAGDKVLSNEYRKLHKAIKEGNITECERLLRGGLDVNDCQHHCRTALGIAAAAGFLPMLELLLRNGSIVNLPDNLGRTALFHAVANRQHEVMNALLKAGSTVTLQAVSPISPDKIKNTALSCILECIKNNDARALAIILEAGADPNIDCPESPIHVAVSKNSIELVSLLMQYGADVNSRTTVLKMTPLHIAIGETKNVEMVDLLLPKSQPNLICRDGRTALHFAAMNADIALIKKLGEFGWSGNFLSVQGDAPHMLRKEPAVIKALYQYAGTDVNLVNRPVIPIHGYADKDWASLHHACAVFKQVNIPYIEALLECHANANQKDAYDETPLHIAAKRGYLDVVKLLLRYGANPWLVNICHATPLICGIQEGKQDVVELLTRIGMRLTLQNLYEENHYEFMRSLFPASFMDWFMEQSLSPVSLSCQTCRVLRAHIWNDKDPLSFPNRVHQLRLPTSVLNFICLVEPDTLQS